MTRLYLLRFRMGYLKRVTLNKTSVIKVKQANDILDFYYFFSYTYMYKKISCNISIDLYPIMFIKNNKVKLRKKVEII